MNVLLRGDVAHLEELAAVIRAHARYRAYQRRWRVGGNDYGNVILKKAHLDAWEWAEAHVRRMRVLERRQPLERCS
jgi:hypothetical protein